MTIDLFIQRVRAECAGQPFRLHEYRKCIYEIMLTFIERGKSVYDPLTKFCNFAVAVDMVEQANFDPARSTVNKIAAIWKPADAGGKVER